MILPEEITKIRLPEMIKVRQLFDDCHLENTTDAVMNEAVRFVNTMKKGSSVAVLTGSRGICNIDLIVRTVVEALSEAGLKPFIIPAMGSHGGGTSDGQLAVLRSYGITEETMGVPINSSMDTEIIGETPDGIEVHFSKPALEADYVIPIGRVKPHTDFSGKIESGLCKMLAIGGGKHNGCSRLHREGFQALAHVIPDAAEIILGKVSVPFGLAIIENAFDKTHTVEAVAGDNILSREPELLKLAKELMPRIKFEDVDVLIIEQIGKDISGTGMDPNIIGRDTTGQLPDARTKVKRIIIKDISEGAHGNAIGFGMADFILRSAVDKIDFNATYTNGIASCNPDGMKIPVIAENEDQAIRAALQTGIGTDILDPKIVRIKDTLHISEIEISENMLDLCKDENEFYIIG